MSAEAIAEPAYQESIKIASYGRWGSRKTEQINTLIREFGRDQVVVVNAEGGLGPIESAVNPANVLRVTDRSGLRDAWAKVSKTWNTDQHWVCLDGMSAVMGWIANEQFAGANAYYDQLCLGYPHEAIDAKLKPFGKFLSNKDEVDGQKIYGEIGRQSEMLLAAWVSLKANLYATYLEDMTGQAGREKSIPWGPDVPGKVGLKAVMSKFDHIFRLTYTDKGELKAGLDPASPLYLSRTREDRRKAGIVPKEIVGFDLGRFIQQYLRGEK